VKKLASIGAVACLLFASAEAPKAHEPPDVLYFMWSWPAGLPAFDGNLSEWDVLPEEHWFTQTDFGDRIFQSSPSTAAVTTGIDPARLSFRFAPAAGVDDDRFWFAYERFDDSWTGWSDIEPKIDADHSGGSFWEEEGMTEDEAKRAKSRGAQPWHLWFSRGAQGGAADWAWQWTTAADWYGDPRFMDARYSFSGEPLSDEEFHLVAEFYLPGYDDFKWDDPDYSFDNIHDIQEGDIMGMAVEINDTYAGCSDEMGECHSRWSFQTFNDSFGNADFFTDFLVLPLDQDALATAVQEDSWGAIKASASVR
jgi:hypothetical protein